MAGVDRKWLTLTVVCVAVFMLLLDITIVNVALPDIGRSLHANFTDIQWVIDAYSLTLAAFAFTWLSLGLGLVARSVETASNLPMFLILLPFFGSGFVPTESMPRVSAPTLQPVGLTLMLSYMTWSLCQSPQSLKRERRNYPNLRLRVKL